VAPAARADNPFSCPAPRSLVRQKTEPVHQPTLAAGGKIVLEADDIKSSADGHETAKGHVIARQGERLMHSEDADYEKNNDTVRVKGKLEYEDPLIHLTGLDGEYSSLGGGSFHEAQFELLQRDAHGSAQLVDLTPAGILRLKEVTFSTCPTTEETWQILAGQLTLDSGEHQGVARDARVDFEGVPILYLPWLSFPLDDERKTGFLFPSIGTNSRSGFELSTPWYWNIAPQEDLLLTPTYYTRRGIDIGGDARYLTDDQHGELLWHFLPYDAQASREGLSIHDRSYVHLTQTTDLPDNFRFAIDAANVGDPLYFQDFGQGPEGTSVAYLGRTAGLYYRDQNWSLAARFQQYQTLDALQQLLDPTQLPYARVPQIVADSDFVVGPAGILHYGFNSEVVNFERNSGVTGWRLDLRPDATLHFEGPGYFVRPGVAYEFTQYSLDDTAPGQAHGPRRSLPTASLDTGLLFERAADRGVRTLTLEPRVQYVYTPYRAQDQLPLFDTALPDLNLVELFRTNRFVGVDRIGDANQVTAALTSRLLDTSSGRQFLSATLGETYYFRPPRVQIPLEPTIGLRSDLVAEVALTAYKNWSVNLGEQWDPQTSASDRSIVELQFKPADDAVVNLAYRFQRNDPAEQQAENQALALFYQQTYASELSQGLSPLQAQAQAQALTQAYRLTPDSLDQVEASTAWPILRNWNAYARVVYALDQHQMLERFAGFEFRGCCWGIRILARRALSNSTGRQDTGIFVQLELNGLASVGSEAGTFLGTAIRGYSPNNVTP